MKKLNQSQSIIYLDTKINGAVKQTIKYFDAKVFDRENVLIVWKYYPGLLKGTLRKYSKMFDKANIKHFPFKKYAQIPNLDGKVIFYLFNAQSNCRIVSNREARHIFVSHGESHKLSSAKPILRIYDYVVVSGDVGIERFLSQKIFSQCDIESGRVIKMGSTFIGDTQYGYDANSEYILYAPTWEGGLPTENYSSIDKELMSFKKIYEYMKKRNKRKIIMQPHPNLGHRDKQYIKYLTNGILYLVKKGIEVSLSSWETTNSQLLLMKSIAKVTTHVTDHKVSLSFCDISAMEIQLMQYNIPTFIFMNHNKNTMPSNSLLEEYYNSFGIYMDIDEFEVNIDLKLLNQAKNYFLGYENNKLEKLSKEKRVEWLKNYVF